jgi:hypothetical protein
MTRRDYIRIAWALRSTYSTACETGQSAEHLEGLLRAAYSIGVSLAEDNLRLNVNQFMDAIRCVNPVEPLTRTKNTEAAPKLSRVRS